MLVLQQIWGDYNTHMKLAFYIHIPYCSKRCGYCDFNTYTPFELKITSGLKKISGAYIDLAIREINLAKNKIGQDVTVSSIFFGGGTPSLMQPLDIGKVINKIRSEEVLSLLCNTCGHTPL